MLMIAFGMVTSYEVSHRTFRPPLFDFLTILWASMRELASRRTFLVVIVAVALGAGLVFRRSESDRIRNQLQDLVDSLGFEDRTAKAKAPERLRAAAAASIGREVIVALEPHGESSLQRDSLIESFVAWSTQWSALNVRVEHLSVNLDSPALHAMAKGEAQLVRVDASGVRWTEPRKFAITMDRVGKDWLVRQIRVSQPRIDQPEARP